MSEASPLPAARAVPLQGAHLIEASAGTGKTWTLAVLVARLLLEGGLACRKVLLVTFTRAATAEIRGRVLTLLQQLDAAQPGDDDPAVQVVREAISAAGVDAAVYRERLRQALLSVDELNISTLHGFYQRSLAEHALAAGDLMDAQLTTDTAAPLLELAHEFWQARFAAPDALSQFAASERAEMAHRLLRDTALATPEALARWVSPWLSRQGLVAQGPVGSEGAPEAAAAAYARLRDARAACAQHFDEAQVRSIVTAHASLNRNKYRPVPQARYVGELAAWLAQGAVFPADKSVLARLEKSFTPQALEGGTLKGKTPPGHPFFDAVQAYLDELPAFETELALMQAALRRAFYDFACGELPRRLAQAGQRSTDRIIGQLAELLDSQVGDALTKSLRQRYQAVLVDEFQDTDLVQWRLLHRVFAQHAPGLFVVVGDPKQAIYSFRGADVRAYLAAREALPSRFALRDNHRSTPRLINALNALFESAHDEPLFGEAGIRYSLVNSAVPRSKEKEIDEYSSSVEVIALHDKAPEEALAAVAARRIAALLASAEVHLRPADIAVLVRTNDQAQAVKHALQSLRLSASLRTRASVFDSFEAVQLGWLLTALTEPQRDAAVVALGFSPLLGCTLQALAERRENPAQRIAARAQVTAWAAMAARLGVMAAVEQIVRDCRTFERWAVLPDGERRITNLRHLLELCEQAVVAGHATLDELRAWLQAERDAPTPAEAALLRLESEGDTVNILTIHRSKGLQFPVVVLPYLGVPATPRPQRGELLRAAPDANVLDFGPQFDAQALADAQRDEEGEAMRLAYVALTRAQRKCVLVWPPDDEAQGSPLARLLGGRSWGQLAKATQGAVQVLADAPAARGHSAWDAARDEQAPTEPPEPRNAGRPWRISSYSGLVARAEAEAAERPDHDRHVPQPRVAEARTADDARWAFPAGARAGECLHAMLERITFARRDAWPTVIQAALQEQGLPTSLAAGTAEWLRHVTQASLQDRQRAAPFALADLNEVQCRREWEFHLPAATCDAATVQQALRQAGLASLPAGVALDTGYLRGFIDLVFEHDGRYYVADYKSNWLGGKGSDYANAALDDAMREAHYDLQAALYQLALHRQLRAALPGYEPARHLGGAFYLFLRGMHVDAGDGVWHGVLQPAQLSALDALFLPEAA